MPVLSLLLVLHAADGGIEEVREVFAEVEAAISAQTLTSERVQDCSGGGYAELEVFRDGQGLIRKLERVDGSDDHLETASSYYDARGRLRFLFIKAGAVPSAHVEARWWFDPQGTVLKHRREEGGEGPTWFGTELKRALVRDPAKFLKEIKLCPPGTER